jgi:3-keto-5-aminohexanoate cleavage enzyme
MRQTSSPTDLVPFVHAHDGGEPWAICAFGATEHACVTAAAAMGGHVRVGFENNLLLKDGSQAPNNESLVGQAADAASCVARPLATAFEIRQRFGAH